jgi:CAAX protease family protein
MIIWISIVFFVCLGVIDLVLYRRHIQLDAQKSHKLVYYSQLLLELWIPAIILAILVGIQVVDPSQLGLNWYSLESALLPGWLSMVILVISLLAIAFLLQDIIHYKASKRYQEQIDSKIKQVKLPAYFEHMIPQTAVEKRVFLLLSLSAGVLEEFLFRGYLIPVLADGSSGLRLWVALVVAAMLFSMGHLYQGLGGAVKTFVIGLIMGLIFIATGSVLNCIILHIIIDVSSSMYNFSRKSEIQKLCVSQQQLEHQQST